MLYSLASLRNQNRQLGDMVSRIVSLDPTDPRGMPTSRRIGDASTLSTEQQGSGGFESFLGNFFTTALTTAGTYYNNVLQTDLTKTQAQIQAQNAANTAATLALQAKVNAASKPSTTPSWVLPVGAAVMIGLLVVMVASRKK